MAARTRAPFHRVDTDNIAAGSQSTSSSEDISSQEGKTATADVFPVSETDSIPSSYDEKNATSGEKESESPRILHLDHGDNFPIDFDALPPQKVTVVPDEDDEFIDPRLKNYPIPLVAKTVDLHNDPT